MMDYIAELQIKWQQTWRDLSIVRPGRAECNQNELDAGNEKIYQQGFQLLVNAYTQPDRHYHNLTHIHQVLTTLDRFSATIDNPLAVYFAAWFHDFVYNSQASDNELQSTKAAKEVLISIGAEHKLIDRVQELIMATQGHQIAANDRDRCIFLDADLAILGADPARYQAYSRSIRREYSWVSDSAYQAGRIRVLESFLHRDRLYYTEILFGELESMARNNMSCEIDRLKIVS
jgi:predicted metal-dependent HD superfamily phosphohydrolase